MEQKLVNCLRAKNNVDNMLIQINEMRFLVTLDMGAQYILCHTMTADRRYSSVIKKKTLMQTLIPLPRITYSDVICGIYFISFH